MDRNEERITELEKTVSKLTTVLYDMIEKYNHHAHETTVTETASCGCCSNTYSGPDTEAISAYYKVNIEESE